ncbi:PPR4 [Symbiodinium sp. CCMP2592]|nr:PPR4 [Symbiodinium sp. CCMP2592]
MDACARTGDVSRAAVWMNNMVSGEVLPNLVSYNSMLKACGKAGDVTSAFEWLEAIEKVQLQPDIISWSSALAACGNARPRARDAAERIFRHFAQSGLEPDRVFLMTLARAVGPIPGARAGSVVM